MRILNRKQIEHRFHQLNLQYGHETLTQNPHLLFDGIGPDDLMPFDYCTYDFLKAERQNQWDDGRYLRETALLLFKLVEIEPILQYLNLRVDGPRFQGSSLTRTLEISGYNRIPLNTASELSKFAVRTAEQRCYAWNYSPTERTYQEKILSPIIKTSIKKKIPKWLQVHDGSKGGNPKTYCGPFCTDFLFVGMHLLHEELDVDHPVPPAHAVVFEVDGPIHDKKTVKDEVRDWFLRSIGVKVCRFPNSEIERFGAKYPIDVLNQAISGPAPWSLHSNGQPKTNKQQRETFLRTIYIYNIASHLTLEEVDRFCCDRLGWNYKLAGGLAFLINQKSSNRKIQCFRKIIKPHLVFP